MTAFACIVLADLDARPFESGAPDPARIVHGAPQWRTWMLDEGEDGKRLAGVWESTTGAWRVAYDEWEFCTILSGVSALVPEGAAPITLRAGDTFVISPGFAGVWNVIESTRKSFVIKLP